MAEEQSETQFSVQVKTQLAVDAVIFTASLRFDLKKAIMLEKEVRWWNVCEGRGMEKNFRLRSAVPKVPHKASGFRM